MFFRYITSYIISRIGELANTMDISCERESSKSLHFLINNQGDMYEYYMRLDRDDIDDLCRRRLVSRKGDKRSIVARLIRQDRNTTSTYSNL
jgi:hypothetical protein